MLLLQKLHEDSLGLSKDSSSLLRLCSSSLTRGCLIGSVCCPWKEKEELSLSLYCFLPPNSTVFCFLTWAQWSYLFLGEGPRRSEEFSGFPSLGYCAVEEFWGWVDGEPHESFVDCCQVYTSRSHRVCLFSDLIPAFVWNSVNCTIFRTPWWIRHSPWFWEAYNLIGEKRHTHVYEIYLRKVLFTTYIH